MFIRFLKKHFIPHEGNDHKPHFLRSETTVVILGVVLFVELVFLFQALVFIPTTNFFASVLPSVLVDGTNAGRVSNSRTPLAVSQLLVEAAQLKANDMAARGYFSHNSPDGKTPWYWLGQVGYGYAYAGENLAVNFVDSEDIVLAWMNSPTHRANILSDKFTEVGIAAARGTYEGREVTFVAQFFGWPLAAAASPALAEEGSAGTPSVAVAPPPAPIAPPESVPAVEGKTIKLAPATDVNHPSAIVKILAKPRSVNTYIFLALLALVTVALLLNVLVKIKVQHPHLIANGVLLLAIIGLAYLVNQLVGLYNAQIL